MSEMLLPCQNLMATVVRCRPEIPATLYHYIPASKAPYLFDRYADISCRYITHLSDPEELRFGVSKVVDYWHRKSVISDALKECLLDAANRNRDNPAVEPAIFSFTEAYDSTKHWQEYADNGNGYCVGISRSKLDCALDAIIRQGNHSIQVVPCFYDRKDAEALSMLYDAAAIDVCEEIAILNRDIGNGNAGRRVLFTLWMLCVMIKREKFRKESEWRLVMATPPVDTAEGFVKTGLRLQMEDRDIIKLFENVTFPTAVCYFPCQRQLGRMLKSFRVHQRNKDLKWAV